MFKDRPLIKLQAATALLLMMTGIHQAAALALKDNTTRKVDSCAVDVQVENCKRQEFLIHLQEDFHHVGVCMRIGSCYDYDVYRGNRYLADKLVEVNQGDPQASRRGQREESEAKAVQLMLSSKVINNTHTYRLEIRGEQGKTYVETVNTTVMCGRCHGFKLKSVGATICPKPKPSSLQRDVQSIQSTLSLSPPGDKNIHKAIQEMQHWTSSAYVVGAGFSVAIYLAFLTVQACRK